MSNYEAEREMWDDATRSGRPTQTSATPALSAMFTRVIRNKFVKPCEACGATVAVEAGYSAVGSAKDWHTFCGECGVLASTQLLARMYTVAIEQARALGDIPQAVRDAVEEAKRTLQQVVATPDSMTLFLAGYADMVTVRRAIADANLAEVVAGLTDDPLYQGLTLALTYTQGRFREAAESMLAQWERKGSLSVKQVSFATVIAERATQAAEKAAPLPDVPPALYIDDAGTVRRIYRIGSARIGCRKYDGTTFGAEGPTGVRSVADGIAAGTTRQLTGDEATAFGRQHGRCFNCLAIGRPGVLSEDRSLAVGYGPDCAEHHGWFYPSAEQAAAILRPQS